MYRLFSVVFLLFSFIFVTNASSELRRLKIYKNHPSLIHARSELWFTGLDSLKVNDALKQNMFMEKLKLLNQMGMDLQRSLNSKIK